jgi:hypothetical protein
MGGHPPASGPALPVGRPNCPAGAGQEGKGRVLRLSDALVDQLREECRGDQELAPLGVKRRRGLSREGLVAPFTSLRRLLLGHSGGRANRR